MLVIVLVATVAATIAMTGVQLGLNRLQSEVRATEFDSARNVANAARDRVRADLEQDPTIVMRQVLDDELPRVCLQDMSLVTAGQAWPERCGTAWGYRAAEPADNLALTVSPPGPGNPYMVIRTGARVGNSSIGFKDVYMPGGAYRPRVYSGTSLDLSTLSSSPGKAIDFPVHSSGEVTFGSADPQKGALVAAEKGFPSGTPGGSDVVYADASGTYTPIRAVYEEALSGGLVRANATALKSFACAAGSDALNIPDTVTSTGLCLKSGGSALDESDATINLGTVGAFLILPSATDGAIDVYKRGSDYPTRIAPFENCAGCNVNTLPTGNLSPGDLSFWTSVGTFRVPSSGVIHTDRTTYVGLCGSGYTGGSCATHGPVPEKSTFEKGMTIVAGTPDSPRDIVVAGPIQGTSDGRVGLVTTGNLVAPFFAAPAGSGLQVSADSVIVGNASGASIRSLPASTPSAGQRAALVISGSVIAADLTVNVPAYSSYEITPPTSTLTAPWMPAPSLRWERDRTTRLTTTEIESQFDSPESLSGVAPVDSGAGAVPLPPVLDTGVIDNDVVLSWPPVSEADSYKVFRIGVPDPVCEGAVFTCVDMDLPAGAKYDYVVIAQNTNGYSNASNKGRAQIGSAPYAPENLVAAPASDGSVFLTWDPPVNDGASPVTDYVIQYATASKVGPFLTYADGTSNNLSLTVTGLDPARDHWFRVAATNNQGTGAYTHYDQYAPSWSTSGPAAVTGLTVDSVTSSSVSLSWTNTNGPKATYRVERAPVMPGSIPGTWSTAQTSGWTSSSVTVTGLPSSASFFYRVVVTAGGLSAPSAAIPATTS